MDHPSLQMFRKRLIDMKNELQAAEELAAESLRPVELDPGRVGRLSRMDAMQSHEMAKEASRRRQLALYEVDRALARIDSRAYGICTHCEKPIDHRRLEAEPTALRCIRCAS